jgi:ribosomal protein S18 acetylase RimI-like enzyme
MVCRKLNNDAVRGVPEGYRTRLIRKSELNFWMDFQFDDAQTALEYRGFMMDFYENVYLAREAEFFSRCRFVCDCDDVPVGTAFMWKAYGKIMTLHWFKVRKSDQDKGIGRALLSTLMLELSDEDYPVYLHTHPESVRAVKLYSDFGFQLIRNPVVGSRSNDLVEGLKYLKEHMLPEAYEKLEFTEAPADFLGVVAAGTFDEF